RSKSSYQIALKTAGFPKITTEIIPAPPFYYADNDHQQYLAKNPEGYCGLGGTGIKYPD
ncbi:MAG: peptide-methionine (S)-S-oxide reductase, partial [Methylococcales bacterium]|nr:peptide-methionine (S)-S-oxide reductase [Methylococcales bacterium]